MAKVAEMFPALSGTTLASWVPSVPFQRSRTGSEADTLAEFTRKDEPVTVTESEALPAVLDRLRVARLVHAKAAAPAMTDAAAAAPKTVVTFLRRFMSRLPTFISVRDAECSRHAVTGAIVSFDRESFNKPCDAVPDPHLDANQVHRLHIVPHLR